MVTKFKLFVLLLLSMFLLSCKKDIVDKYTGNYYFTTAVHWWDVSGTGDSTFYYYGSISADTDNRLKIEFGSNSNTLLFYNGTIYPIVDDNGNLSYPDWTKDPLKLFVGSFNDNGDLNITMSTSHLGGGSQNIIQGIKY